MPANISLFISIPVLSIVQTISAQQQKFRVTPHDLQVLEGSEALLRCEVSNLAGQVQWTKDGFALGKFTRDKTFYISFCEWDMRGSCGRYEET